MNVCSPDAPCLLFADMTVHSAVVFFDCQSLTFSSGWFVSSHDAVSLNSSEASTNTISSVKRHTDIIFSFVSYLIAVIHHSEQLWKELNFIHHLVYLQLLKLRWTHLWTGSFHIWMFDFFVFSLLFVPLGSRLFSPRPQEAQVRAEVGFKSNQACECVWWCVKES